jgi:hypothetical protein
VLENFQQWEPIRSKFEREYARAERVNARTGKQTVAVPPISQIIDPFVKQYVKIIRIPKAGIPAAEAFGKKVENEISRTIMKQQKIPYRIIQDALDVSWEAMPENVRKSVAEPELDGLEEFSME